MTSTTDIPTEARWLTEDQAATMVQIAPRTVRKWASCGRFPRGIPLDPQNPRSRKRWVRAEVEEWIRQREAEARA